MIITKIELQKKKKNRYSIFLDGIFAFGISDFDAFRFHLKEGNTITEEELERIRNDVLLQDAKQYALKLLDRKEYTEAGIKAKLTEHGCDRICIDLTVQFLKDYRYIDDEEYAKRYITSALWSGKSGMRKIEYDLSRKGISRCIIENVVQDLDVSEFQSHEYDAIMEIMMKKTKGDFSFSSLMKGKRYCLSRGFSSDMIDAVVRKMKNNDEEVWSDV